MSDKWTLTSNCTPNFVGKYLVCVCGKDGPKVISQHWSFNKRTKRFHWSTHSPVEVYAWIKYPDVFDPNYYYSRGKHCAENKTEWTLTKDAYPILSGRYLVSAYVHSLGCITKIQEETGWHTTLNNGCIFPEKEQEAMKSRWKYHGIYAWMEMPTPLPVEVLKEENDKREYQEKDPNFLEYSHYWEITNET